MTRGEEVVAASWKVCAGLDADHIAACIDVTLLALIERCAGVAETAFVDDGTGSWNGHYKNAGIHIAAAIRALLGEEKG